MSSFSAFRFVAEAVASRTKFQADAFNASPVASENKGLSSSALMVSRGTFARVFIPFKRWF